MLYSFFGEILQRLKFIRRYGTLSLCKQVFTRPTKLQQNVYRKCGTPSCNWSVATEEKENEVGLPVRVL